MEAECKRREAGGRETRCVREAETEYKRIEAGGRETKCV